MHNHHFGLLAEYLVIIRYMFHGYLPIKHRWKSNLGEIDLIMRRGKSIIFCEVKARSSNFLDASECVSHNQKNRLKKSSEYFLALHPKWCIKQVRFDLAIVRSFSDIKIYKDWIGL